MSNGHKIQRTQKCWDFVIDGYLTSGLLSMGKMTTGMCPSLKYAKKTHIFACVGALKKNCGCFCATLAIFLRAPMHTNNYAKSCKKNCSPPPLFTSLLRLCGVFRLSCLRSVYMQKKYLGRPRTLYDSCEIQLTSKVLHKISM